MPERGFQVAKEFEYALLNHSLLYKRSTESSESVFLWPVKNIIVCKSFAEWEGRGCSDPQGQGVTGSWWTAGLEVTSRAVVRHWLNQTQTHNQCEDLPVLLTLTEGVLIQLGFKGTLWPLVTVWSNVLMSRSQQFSSQVITYQLFSCARHGFV